jgi:hypothetical protein
MNIKLNGKRGGFAIVSKEDFDELSKFKWSLNQNGYVIGTINNKRTYMHTYIMNTPKGKVVDHINGTRHDNRRENLRISTVAKNNENKKISTRKHSSIFLGVFGKDQKYHVECVHDGVKYQLGNFINEIEAAETRDRYIVQNKLDHITLNFPEKRDNYMKSVKIIPIKKKYSGVTFNENIKNTKRNF